MLAPRRADPGTGWLSRERLAALALLGATAIALFLCYRIIQPFLPALTWALALAVVTSPVHRWLARRIRQPGVASAVTVALVALVIVGPVALISQQLIDEAGHAAEVIGSTIDRVRSHVESDPRLRFIPRWLGVQIDAEEIASRVSGALGARSGAIVSGSAWVAMQLLVTLFLLFYFFRDRSSGARFLRSILPLSDAESSAMFQFVTSTIRATVFGSLGVAAVQGVMGGLMFWLLGLPSALFWGAVMALFATIPMLGTFVIWAPAAAILAAGGEWIKALILVAWGGTAIALIDNLLYPILVGNQLRVHAVLVFFSVVGGIVFYGAAGIILGPLTLATAIGLIDIWRWRTAGHRMADASEAPAPAVAAEPSANDARTGQAPAAPPGPPEGASSRMDPQPAPPSPPRSVAEHGGQPAFGTVPERSPRPDRA